MQDQLRQTCRQLLAEGTVQVVVGYGQDSPGEPAYPLFVTRPEEADQLVWNPACQANLVKHLLRPEIRALGKPAIVVKGCDERALVVLEKESQIERSQLFVIGMACPSPLRTPAEGGSGEDQGDGQTGIAARPAKCAACDVPAPRFADKLIGEPGPPAADGDRYADLAELMRKSPAERMAYWREELSRCVKCYACRQVCPMCYCQRCIADKNRPTAIDTSATPKGNFAWHITRAFHLAGRCVGCDECTRVCPAGIDLRLLNLSLARAAEEQFHFRAGMDPAAEPIIGAYSVQDKEAFIR